MTFNTEQLKYLSIVSKKVDNPGAGDCAFYSFAIGLIDLIQNEHLTSNKHTFTRWVMHDEGVSNLYERMLKFDFDREKQDRGLLDTLQKSLRKIVYDSEIGQLKADSALAIRQVFAIVLIDIFKAEHAANSRETFDYLVSLVPEFESAYDQLIAFDIDNHDQSNVPVHMLEAIINKFPEDTKLNEIKKQHADKIKNHRSGYGPIEQNLVFIKFGELYYENHINVKHVDSVQNGIADKNANDLNRSKTLMNKISEFKQKLVIDPQASFAAKLAEENRALRGLFFDLLYGPEIDLVTINEETEFDSKSPILEGLAKVKEVGFWGNQEHLELLTRAFEVNFHYLRNGETPFEFIDIPDRPVITVNNHGYAHWTTKISIAVPISHEKEKVTLTADELPTYFGNGRNRFMMYKPAPKPVAAPVAPRPVITYTKDADAKKVKQIKEIRSAISDLHRNLIELHKSDIKMRNRGRVPFGKETNTKNRYSLAYESGEKIRRKLDQFCEQYEHNGMSFVVFQSKIESLLSTGSIIERDGNKSYRFELDILRKHRGYGEWLVNFMIALFTAGIAHIGLSVVESRFKLFHIPTKSEKLMEGIRKASINAQELPVEKPATEEPEKNVEATDKVLGDSPIQFEPKNNPFHINLNPFSRR